MELERLGPRWQELIEEVVTGLRDWRSAHPRASFAEIEAAVEERLNRLRARLVEEAALASAAAHLGGRAPAERGRCPECRQRLQARGERERELLIQGGQAVRLRRSYAVCPDCGTGLFPPG